MPVRVILPSVKTICQLIKCCAMEIKMQVLEAMKKAGAPINAGKIVEITCLERKEVDKAMNILKAEGTIVSPRRCYWQPK